jgi:predicted ester cyclase
VVGVGVGADEQADVLHPQADLVQRALQVGERAGLVHARVDEHDAVARRDRPGVAVRHAGPGQRQAQAPEPGQDPLAAADLALAGGVGHRRGTLKAAGYAAAMSTVAADPAAVAERYFAALAARDLDAMVACWAPGGREFIRGQVDTTAPDGLRAYFGALFAAVPDLDVRVEATTVEGERACVRWVARGTFAGAPFRDIEPTGARLELEGIDELTVSDGLIQANNAFSDGLAFARQVGMLPAEGTTADRGLTRAFNVRTRALHRLTGSDPEPIADGVWIVRGGFPEKGFNVYLVRDGDGVLAFDAGIRQMAPVIARAAANLGGLTRVVLGHSHADHPRRPPRGLGRPGGATRPSAPTPRATAGCTPSTWRKLGSRQTPRVASSCPSWDGGPVRRAARCAEGDDVRGLRGGPPAPATQPGSSRLGRASTARLDLGLLLHRGRRAGFKGAAAPSPTRRSRRSRAGPGRPCASSPRLEPAAAGRVTDGP